jgi:hypothetical protein
MVGQSLLILSTRSRFRGVLLIQIEKNVATLDAHGECFQASVLRIYATARAHIELPMMPRATESLFHQVALAQPAFLVGTRVSIGKDVVLNVDQQNIDSTHVQAQHFAAPEVV